MRKMAAGSFQATCLAVMDEIQDKHETVVIAKRGKPVAKLVALNTETGEIYNFRLIGALVQVRLFGPRFPVKNRASLTDSPSYACRRLACF